MGRCLRANTHQKKGVGQMSDEEEWKDIEGYEGLYQVSSRARIKSLERMVPGRWGHDRIVREKIIETRNCAIYPTICLWRGNTKKSVRVHVLVAQAFILNPENKPQVNHKDGNKQNCLPNNLEWATVSENARHAFDNKLRVAVKGEKSNFSKLTSSQVFEIRESLLSEKLNHKEVASRFGVTLGTIRNIENQKTWKHV